MDIYTQRRSLWAAYVARRTSRRNYNSSHVRPHASVDRCDHILDPCLQINSPNVGSINPILNIIRPKEV